ncbi:hypothetical protein QTP86_018044 [Hemibagrus guttatus]|nr:hypothetical protein QTP86_018044 [Hemibagrus guttatus]
MSREREKLQTSKMSLQEEQHKRRLRKFGTNPSFYTCTVESILTGCITTWYGNASLLIAEHCRELSERPDTLSEVSFPPSRISVSRCVRKARKIFKDPTHLSHKLLSLLYSGYSIPKLAD